MFYVSNSLNLNGLGKKRGITFLMLNLIQYSGNTDSKSFLKHPKPTVKFHEGDLLSFYHKTS